jgi:hypothetical protein
VQNQERIVWPRKLVVAKAYLDQLERSQALPVDRIATLRQAIRSAETARLNRSAVAKLKSLAPSVEQSAGAAQNAVDANRLHALADILSRPSR